MPANQSTPEVTRATMIADIIAECVSGPQWQGDDIRKAHRQDQLTAAARIIALFPATPARGGDELREALQASLEFACLTLAFHGRDRGTDRQERMLDDLEELARKLDPQMRKALASTDMAGAEKLAQDSETLAAQATSTSEAEQLRAYARGIRRGAVLSAPPVEGLTSGEARDVLRMILPLAQAWMRHAGIDVATDDDPPIYEAQRKAIADAEAMLAPSPNVTATAIVQEEAVARVTAAWSVMMRRFGGAFGDIDNGYFPEVEEMRRSVATLTDSGTAATIGGERA